MTNNGTRLSKRVVSILVLESRGQVFEFESYVIRGQAFRSRGVRSLNLNPTVYGVRPLSFDGGIMSTQKSMN